MNRTAAIVGTVLIFGGCFAIVEIVIVGFMFRTPCPPQPEFGFTGDWRPYNAFGTEERRLPPASEIWQEHDTWNPKTDHARRLFVARLGGADRQTSFVASTNSGDTPLGAQEYTNVNFTYTDSTNGTFRIRWMMRGKHDPGFLRFDERYRLYQLELTGEKNQFPPELSIRGIEGIKPEHYRKR